MKLRRENEEVFYTEDTVVCVGRKEIDFLKAQALANPRSRVRLCTHLTPDNPLHEMLILHGRDTYVRPHKHLNKSESFHIIEGTGVIVLFDEKGLPTQTIPMGDLASGHFFYYRLAKAAYHTVVITSDILIFHESTNGPFHREETLFAPWAPDLSDTKAATEYLSHLKIQISSAKSRKS
jgi:cupin fold WbuC family metalloprotein